MQKPLRLRYLLPMTQMGLGAGLLLWAQIWQRTLMERIHGPVGPTPPFVFLISLNLPVALLRAVWFRHVPSPWDDWLLVPAIGLLWYWVARNIESWRNTKALLRVPWLPVQLTIDILLVAVGVFIGVTCIANLRTMIFLSYLLTEEILGLIWCAALVLVFGWHSISLIWSR